MTLGWRDRFVAWAGLLVLASSFLPWWMVRIRVGTRYETHYGSAWRMSSRWSVAVVITVAAAAAWLVWRMVRGRVPRVVPVIACAAAALSIVLAVAQWRAVEARPLPGSTTTASVRIGVAGRESDPATELADAWMVRDHLRSYHNPGLYVDIGWGIWIGLGAMVLVALSLVVAGSGRSPSRAGAALA
jgi:hypothetical protein